jgi:POT family proton-dependent oligopeptide transporter
VLIAVMTIGGLFWIFNDTYSKITKNNLLTYDGFDFSTYFILFFVLLLFILSIFRIVQYRPVVRDRLIAFYILAFFTVFFWWAFEQAGGSMTIFARDYTDRVLEGNSALVFKIFNTILYMVPLAIITWVLVRLFSATFEKIGISNLVLGASFVVIWGLVIWMLRREFLAEKTEIPASWFSLLNSFFIITLAPLFSRIWESKYNPSGSVKFGIGLILLGLGFAFLAYGSSGIPQGAAAASVSILWLILAYLFHTMGELSLSPVGLSYVTKLVPAGMIAFMFGIWYLAIAIGNKMAGATGGMIDKISNEYDMSTFFLIFTAIPILGGILLIVINPLMKKLMHGVH